MLLGTLAEDRGEKILLNIASGFVGIWLKKCLSKSMHLQEHK